MFCLCWLCCLLFFFFKQKTAYEMRISDWSSDVCSSDLPVPVCIEDIHRGALAAKGRAADGRDDVLACGDSDHLFSPRFMDQFRLGRCLGKAVDAKRWQQKAPLGVSPGGLIDLDSLGSLDRKSTRLYSSHSCEPRMPSCA